MVGLTGPSSEVARTKTRISDHPVRMIKGIKFLIIPWLLTVDSIRSRFRIGWLFNQQSGTRYSVNSALISKHNGLARSGR